MVDSTAPGLMPPPFSISWLPAALMVSALPNSDCVPGTARKESQRSWHVDLSSGVVHSSFTPFSDHCWKL